MSHKCTRHFWNRRDFLFRSGGGISGLALAYLLNQQEVVAQGAAGCASSPVGLNPNAAKAPHFKPRATAVISLFMGGGVSQVDTFDPKPALAKYAGELIDGKVDGDVQVRQGYPGPLMPSPFTFKKHGHSGIEISDLFPHISKHVDDLAFIRSVFGRSNDHVQATYEMQTGQIRNGISQPGFVGYLRPWFRKLEPARVRRADRLTAADPSAGQATGLPDSCRPLIRALSFEPPAIPSSI